MILKSKIEKLGDDPLASGSYSTVWAGMYKEDEDEDEEGRCVAIKVMRGWETDDTPKMTKVTDSCRLHDRA